MSGDDRQRFCEKCQLHVYNVEGLKNKELVNLITETEGKRLCLRLRRRSDGTVITKDCPVGLIASRKRIAITAGMGLGVYLLAMSAWASQDKLVQEKDQFIESFIASPETNPLINMIEQTEPAYPGESMTMDGSIIMGEFPAPDFEQETTDQQ